MSKTIFDMVNAKEIANYWTGIRKPGSLTWCDAFPGRKLLGLDLSWIKGAQGLPVALTPAL